MPKISICIPTYNGQKYLAATLESALSQKGEDIEILILDDCSKDQTLSIVHTYAARDSRFRVISNRKNLGLVGNWNQCLSEARGEWIKFLFQDDLLRPEYCDRIRPHLNEDRPFIVSQRDFIIEPDTPDAIRVVFESNHSLEAFTPNGFFAAPEDFCSSALLLLGHNPFGEPSNIIFHRSLPFLVGPFLPRMSQIVDLEYWYRLGSNFGMTFLGETLSTFRVHGNSTTANHFNDDTFRSRFLDLLILLTELSIQPHFSRMRFHALALDINLSMVQMEVLRKAVTHLEGMASSGTSPSAMDTYVYRPFALACQSYPTLHNLVIENFPTILPALQRQFDQGFIYAS